MFSADDIETVQQMFVQAVCLDWQIRLPQRSLLQLLNDGRRREKCVGKWCTEFQNGGTDIHVYDSSVRHSTSERGVDIARSTELIWKTDDCIFCVYP
jgi:hypothetical protein